MTAPDPPPPDPFLDLAAYAALPRLQGLVLSPDGARLVTSVATPARDAARYTSALWELDPAGGRAPRRLTRSAQGESAPAFLPDGGLLFTSTRPDPDPDPEPGAKGGAGERAALWLLPAGPGEARRVLARPGGVSGVRTARAAATVVVTSPTMAGTSGPEEDEAARAARRGAGVSAVLHDGMPVRHWDHDLGPDEPRLLAAALPAGEDGDLPPPLDLTPAPGRALQEQEHALTPDGRELLTGWAVPVGGGGHPPPALGGVDTATGERRTLAADDHDSFHSPAVSPDGRLAVCVRSTPPTYDEPPERTLWLLDLAAREGRDLTPGLDLWPGAPVFTADSAAVLATADEQGHRPVLRVDLAGGDVVRLTATGAYDDPCPSPDGRHVYAVRSTLGSPPTVVRLDAAAAGQEPVPLPSPGALDAVPGRVEEVRATAADGAPLRAWLVLPAGASPAAPAPLVLWIHGGPHGSWNAWSWRWCPHLLAARGYAVLLPDPALSTGYGRGFLRRGWGQWGGAPYTDLMAATDAALQRPDLDAARTAAMGGSFGGYLANWVAGHTDRFAAIVTHASLWSLEQFQGTTDHPPYWAREWGHPEDRPERYAANSPDRHAASITTPMLVVHGDRDYRVPVGESLRLWGELVRREVPGRFLYFPDENHWVLKPGNAQVWYDAVLAFLDEHVLGAEPRRPRLV